MSKEIHSETVNKSTNVVEQMEIEFHAFNYTTSGIVEKEYVRKSENRNSKGTLSPTIDNKKLLMLLKALENEYISSLSFTRYSLYDVSFRKTNDKDSIGFSFNDTGDYEYLSAKEIFKPFVEFDIDLLTETEITIQRALYKNTPQFNPVFMIATLIENGKLIGLKTYTRHDLKENSDTQKRLNLINTFMNAINPDELKSELFDVSVILENTGLVFNFVGFDCSINNCYRYKLYFRNYGTIKLSNIIDVLNDLVVRFELKNNLSQLETRNNSVWGIAVSTDDCQHVDGIQVYLYP